MASAPKINYCVCLLGPDTVKALFMSYPGNNLTVLYYLLELLSLYCTTKVTVQQKYYMVSCKLYVMDLMVLGFCNEIPFRSQMCLEKFYIPSNRSTWGYLETMQISLKIG